MSTWTDPHRFVFITFAARGKIRGGGKGRSVRSRKYGGCSRLLIDAGETWVPRGTELLIGADLADGPLCLTGGGFTNGSQHGLWPKVRRRYRECPMLGIVIWRLYRMGALGEAVQ